MGDRLELHEELCSLIGTRNVYFQPPESVKLTYPCIIYSLDRYTSDNADDVKYQIHKQYSVQIVDRNPDSVLPMKMMQMRYCQFDRQYVADNLHHFSFTIFY